MDVFLRLLEVIVRGDGVREVMELVQEEVDVNYGTSNGTTILHCCSLYGRTGVMGYLVGLGADINARDLNQMTPLHFALAEETSNIMKQRIIMEQWRGKIVEWNEDKELLVLGLVEKKQKELIDCLINLGADINAKYNTDVTSLDEAIRLNKMQEIRVLAKLGLAKSSLSIKSGMTALLLATEQGQKEVMKHLVQNGADIHASCCTIPPLHQAVESGNVEMVQTLLENGADVNSLKYENITPVYHAVQHQPADMGVFTCLAHLGADFNAQCVITRAVHNAVAQESPEMLDCILKHVPDVQSPHIDHIIKQPPIVGVESSNFHLLEQLVKCGVDPNTTFDNTISTLVQASRTRNIEMVKKLVEHGFKINVAKVFVGVTAFYCYLLQKSASPTQQNMSNIIQSVKVLIDLGANINATVDQLPVLHDAVTRGDVNMVIALSKLGANMMEIGYRGSTILNEFMNETKIRSCDFDNDIMKFLVETKTDSNTGYDVIPPLIPAVEHFDKLMVCALVELGANMSQPMAKGVTPLHHACTLDTTYILECLLDHGANPNVEYVEGIEPLLEAIWRRDADMAAFLLQCGANPRVGKEYMKWNPTRIAIDSGDGNVLKCLIKAGVELNPQVSLDATEYLHPISRGMAESLGVSIHNLPNMPATLLTKAIKMTGNLDIVETILDGNSYRQNVDRKPVVTYSDLEAACYFGYLDIVRLLVFDGSIDMRGTQGLLPFDALPMSSYADYHTLYETTETESAIRRMPVVEFNLKPFVLCHEMESLLGIPGLGDVQSIHHPKSKVVHKEVHRAVCEITERFRIFPKVAIKVRPCGSAAEGTKVGLPDEMDFVVEVGSADKRHLESARHDYVCYSQDNHVLFEGSKMFHFNVFNKLRQFVKLHSTSKNGAVTISGFFVSDMINESKRRATTPMCMFWKYQQSPISVDFVPSLHVDNWPESAVQNTWLLSHDELRKHGYYLVPKPPHASSDLAKEYTPVELQILWKISFPHLETYHMQHLEQRVKDAYVLAKCLRNPDVCRILVTDEGSLPRKVDKYVTSYMLKMIFFKNVEEFRHLDMTLGEMVCRVYEGVEEGLSSGFIPLYFMPKVSALGGHKLNIPKCARVAKIMKKFVHALYLRDCRRDPTVSADVDEVVVYQRKPSTVYRSFEIGELGDVTQACQT
jgi:ankyrin repeat protein